MNNNKDNESPSIEAHEIHAHLRAIFEKLPNEVSLLLFTSPEKKDIFSQAARKVIQSIREIAPKVTLREYDISHKEAKELKTEHAPALFINPDRYKNIRWYGAPIGEETRTLVEALIMFGYGETRISTDSKKILDRITSPRNIKVFVSPTCPYCPQQAVNALKVAFERPDLISLEIIDVQANPDLADKYSAQSVPQAYADEKLIAMGAQSEELFMLSLEKMEQQTFFIPDSDAKEVDADLVIIGDGPLFKGKKVLMIGGGDSAVTEALHLNNLGVDVTVVHRRDTLRAQRQLSMSLSTSGIPVVYNTEVNEIRGNDRVEEVEIINKNTGEKYTMPVDAVFISIGYNPVVALARKTGIEITPDGYIRHDERHRTNIPGIYSAGDVEGGYKQIVTAAGHGSEAALAVFEDLVNPYWSKEGI